MYINGVEVATNQYGDYPHFKVFDSIDITDFIKEASFTGGEIFYETGKTTSSLSDTISKDLVRRGGKFVGSVIIYSFLQAVGIICSHDEDCFLFKSH